MNWLKKILLSVLGEKNYLSLLAGSFQRLYKTGRLGKTYQDVYFLHNLVRQGDFCIDIGAHLGYYTLELSRLAGKEGKVFAVEPMHKFNEVLQRLLTRKNAGNVVLYPVALGGEGDYVEMGIPRLGVMKKFAYARVTQSSAQLEYVETEKVKNEQADRLFGGLPRLDFVKCDVEGLEVQVFKGMLQVLQKHQPIILCELLDRNERILMYEMLLPLGYQAYLLSDKKLSLLDVYSYRTAISHNHYFIPLNREEKLKQFLA